MAISWISLGSACGCWSLQRISSYLRWVPIILNFIVHALFLFFFSYWYLFAFCDLWLKVACFSYLISVLYVFSKLLPSPDFVLVHFFFLSDFSLLFISFRNFSFFGFALLFTILFMGSFISLFLTTFWVCEEEETFDLVWSVIVLQCHFKILKQRNEPSSLGRDLEL